METCRTCGKCDFQNEQNWFDLFHPTNWKDKIAQVHEELNIWKLKIAPNDGLPQKICNDCFNKFCDVYSFRNECEVAQLKLRNLFERIEVHSMESEDDDDDEGDNDDTISKNLPSSKSIKRSLDNFATAANEDSLLKIFDLSSQCLLQEPTSNELNELCVEHQPISAVAATNDQTTAVSSATTIAAITTTTTTTKTSTSTPTKDFIADNQSLNNDMTTQQRLNAIQRDLNCSFSENEELLQDLIEIENDVEIETFEGVPIEDLIEELAVDENFNDDEFLGTDATIAAETITPTTTIASTTSSTCVGNVDFSLECKYCFKSKEHPVEKFTSQRLLLVHITSEHDAEFPYTCPRCDQGFRDASARTVHIKKSHVEKHHECDVCGKKYADRSNLRHHIEKYHSENDFECTLCEKRFYSRKSLKYHMKWHEPGNQLKCSYCDRLFINQRHLKCHEATHTGLRNCEICSFCGKSFIHLKTLRWHLFRKHGGEKPYKCSNCEEAFTSYREKRIHMLEFHLKNLTLIEKSECMLCHQHFEDENELKRHMSEDHKPKKAPLITANNKRVLQNKRKKSFSGIFQCDSCSQRFNMKSALERHSKVHSVEGRPFACPQCSKRFKRIQDMNWHMKTHSNEKSNICDICGKGFALKYVLTQHKRSHEVLEKNFKCKTCGRAYLFEKTLRVHERVHTGKTYYKCDLCSESFVTHIQFKYHMSKRHSTLENEELALDELVNIVIPGN